MNISNTSTISVKNLTVRLVREGNRVLSGINLTLEAASITLLIGKTGAGKSTLLRTLSGLGAPTTGEVWIGKDPLFRGKRVNEAAIEPTMLLFQSAERQFFRPTLRSEFDYSLRRFRLQSQAVEARMSTALEAVQLPPDVANVNPRELSGGQQRRAALATTIASDPLWYLLDEPSSGLDGESVRALQDFVVRAAERDGRGFLISTHDLDAWFPIAHRVIVLESGRVCWDGTPRDLCRYPEVLLQAGVGLPTFAKMAGEFGDYGLNVPPDCLSADELADAILQSLSDSRVPVNSLSFDQIHPTFLDVTKKAGHLLTHGLSVDEPLSDGVPNRFGKTSLQPFNPLQSLDARAKWLCYIALSIAWLTIPSPALILATLALGAVYLVLRTAPSSAWRLIRIFAVLMLSASLFAGVGWTSTPAHGPVHAALLSHFTWQWHAALATLVSLYRVLLVVLLSSLFTESTSTISLRTSLEGILQPFSRIGFPSQAFAFATALVLRFVPLLTAEASRFSEIAQVRGKKIRKPGRISLGDAGTFMLPMVFSLFHLGEELSFAMEARGLTHFGTAVRRRRLPRFTKKEWSLLGGTTLFIAMLFVV